MGRGREGKRGEEERGKRKEGRKQAQGNYREETVKARIDVVESVRKV